MRTARSNSQDGAHDLNVMPTSMNEDLFLSCRIGKGSYGEVWRGVVRGRGTARAIDVAAKVVPLDGNNIGAVQHEVELQREAGNHPSVVGLLGCFHHDEAAWLLFELCATSVCDALLRRGAPLEEPMIAAVCAGTLRGLHWLHASCRIVHRDIKCANLLLTVGGEVQIADFGIASRLSDMSNPGSAASQPATARAGTVIGSPLWMAPEMIADGLCDTPVDVWSLGICALEMAQMQPPHADIASPLRAMYGGPTLTLTLTLTLALALTLAYEQVPHRERARARAARRRPLVQRLPRLCRLVSAQGPAHPRPKP